MREVGEIALALDRARNRLRRPIARTPWLFDTLVAARPDRRNLQVRRDSVLLIEGFPRSGNTFSVAAFTLANGARGHVASHLHAPAHVARAVRLGLPAIVLIRHPREACLSYVIRRPAVQLVGALDDYIDFYRAVWPLRNGFVVGGFEQVVSDFGEVIAAVNEKFHTSFERYQPTPENERACFAMVEQGNRNECGGLVRETYVARPSAQRDRLKQRLQNALERGRASALLDEAVQLYRRFVDFQAARSDGRMREPGA